MNTRLSVPKWIELIFDGVYLTSALLLGIWMIGTQQPLQMLWGIMAVTLAAGDSFHLLPRMAAAYTGDTPRFSCAMGYGKLITSLSMTAFYAMLWHSGLQLFGVAYLPQTALLYLLVGVRVVCCLLPQNKWRDGQNNHPIAIYRNLPFALQGLLVMWLYARHAVQVPDVRWMWLAILISFLCYFPVVLWASKYPKVGMLMLPKTCAYLWIICMGLGL